MQWFSVYFGPVPHPYTSIWPPTPTRFLSDFYTRLLCANPVSLYVWFVFYQIASNTYQRNYDHQMAEYRRAWAQHQALMKEKADQEERERQANEAEEAKKAEVGILVVFSNSHCRHAAFFLPCGTEINSFSISTLKCFSNSRCRHVTFFPALRMRN